MRSFALACLGVLCAAHVASADTMALAWDAATGSDVAGYIVSWGTESGVYTQQVNAGNQTQCSVQDLVSGTTYYFVVQAYTSQNVLSDPSNEVDGQLSAGQPSVTSINLTPDMDSPQSPGTTVTWTADATGGVVPYQYKWWQYDGQDWTLLSDWTSDNTYTWTPSVSNPNYQIIISVKSSGNPDDQPELSTLVTFPIG